MIQLNADDIEQILKTVDQMTPKAGDHGGTSDSGISILPVNNRKRTLHPDTIEALSKLQKIVEESEMVSTQTDHVSNMVCTQTNHVSDMVSTQTDHVSDMVSTQTDHVSDMVSTQTDHVSDMVSTQLDHVSDMVSTQTDHVSDMVGT